MSSTDSSTVIVRSATPSLFVTNLWVIFKLTATPVGKGPM